MSREMLPTWIVMAIWGILVLSPACSLFEKSDPNSVDDYPAWSPDGRTIAFIRYSSDRPGIYLVNPNGTNLRLLLAGQFATLCWSPDGKWLVFSTAYVGRMHKVRVNGGSLTRLTDSADLECFYPNWSSNGLVVYESRRGTQGPPVLWLMRPDGSGKRDISRHGVGQWGMPCWSPDGTRIVFCRYYPDTPWPELAVVDSGGRSETRVTTDSSYDVQPAWSPDGRRIAFSSADSGGYRGTVGYRTCVLDLQSGTRKFVATDGAFAPTWSPDGKWLCYSHQWVTGDRGPEQTFVEHGKLWVVDSDGSNARQIIY